MTEAVIILTAMSTGVFIGACFGFGFGRTSEAERVGGVMLESLIFGSVLVAPSLVLILIVMLMVGE